MVTAARAILLVAFTCGVTASTSAATIGPDDAETRQRMRTEIDFARVLVARLVDGFELERDLGRSTSVERVRRQVVDSSAVVNASILMGELASCRDFVSLAAVPSPVQRSAMSFLVDLEASKRAALLQEIADTRIPDGPDHPSEFQPRPQAGNAIGGTFSEFRSEAERREYEKNYQRMIVRNRAKTERFVLEQDLARLERDFAHLIIVVESACDPDGKATLREMLLAAQGDNPRTDPNADAYRSTVALATNIVDTFARSPGETPTPNVLYTPEEWARVLDGLPPDIVLAALRNRADYFRLVTPGDAPAREVFEQTIRVMIAGHRRVRLDWAESNASAPDRRPEPPDFVLRYGGAIVGGRAVAAPPEFRNDEERRAYEAWLVADAEAAERIDRERTLAIRLKRLESEFASIAHKLYVYSPLGLREELIRRLETAGAEDGVDYLKIADLRVSTGLDAD